MKVEGIRNFQFLSVWFLNISDITINMKIIKETTFAELLKEYPEVAEKLKEKGLGCIGCPMARFETIEQGAAMHGINPDELIKDINKGLTEK